MVKQFGYLFLAVGLIAILSETASAQYRPPFQSLNRVGRFLGHGNGYGYHTCNPGPDVSYYRPWSTKNSYLISQSPEFLARYGDDLPKSPMELLRSGQTAFGHPLYGGGLGYGVYGQPTGPSVSADFVPSNRNEGDNTEDGDSVYDNDSSEDAMSNDKNLEDRFEREADAFEDADEATDPGAINDVEAQGSPSDAASEDETTLLLPPTTRPFIPAGYRGRR